MEGRERDYDDDDQHAVINRLATVVDYFPRTTHTRTAITEVLPNT